MTNPAEENSATLSLPEELLLMLLNEESGYFHHVPGWTLNCTLIGAVLAELAFRYRIDLRPRVTVHRRRHSNRHSHAGPLPCGDRRRPGATQHGVLDRAARSPCGRDHRPGARQPG